MSSKNLNREQLLQNLKDRGVDLAGRTPDQWLKDQRNARHLAGPQKPPSPPPVTREQALAGAAQQQARLDAITAKDEQAEAESKERWGTNPYQEILESSSAAQLSPREKKRFKQLAKARSEANEAQAAEAERVQKLQADPHYQAIVGREEKTVNSFPVQYRERVIELFGHVKGDYDTAAFDSAYRALYDEAQASLRANLSDALTGSLQASSSVAGIENELSRLERTDNE